MSPQSNLRIYGNLRSAHLERLAEMVPAEMIYTGIRDDFDASLADPLNPPRPLGRVGVLRELAARSFRVVETNEPAMPARWPFLLACVVTIRIRDLLSRHHTDVTSYCIANADTALEVHDRWSLPRPLARLVSRAALLVLVGLSDRLAFGTSGSRDMYLDYVPKRMLDRRARLFEALPSSCACLIDASETKSPNLVTFVGSFVERKGIRELMDSWDELHSLDPDARLAVMGKGRLESEVREWARGREDISLSLDPPRAEIHETLRRSSVLVLLSQTHRYWREQLGLPILEGLSHGCEIVATSETGIAQWLQEHGHSVLPPGASPQVTAVGIRGALQRAPTRDGSLRDLPSTDRRISADRWMMLGDDA